MKFSYQARTEEGDVQTGFIEASSEEAALGILQQYGLYTTSLTQIKEPFWQKQISFLTQARQKDIVSFTRQLAIMSRSSIPLVESLETIARQTNKPGFKEKILEMAKEIEGGSTISEAFGDFPDIFSSFYIGMLKAGEASGDIPEALDYLADYLEREQGFRSKLIGAMVYPAFVLGVFFFILVIMSIHVVPTFAEIFEDMQMELPITTRIVILAADIVKGWWWAIILTILFLGGLLVRLLKNEDNKRSFDRAALDIPFVNIFFKKVYLSRIALNLSTLISGGVPISQTLKITSDLVGNDVYKEILLETRKGVRSGKNMSSIFSTYPKEFSLLFIQMIIVGEKTGHLEKALKNIVDFYQREVDDMLNAFVKLLEPIMIVMLGGLVAILALSLFVPLFQEGGLAGI